MLKTILQAKASRIINQKMGNAARVITYKVVTSIRKDSQAPLAQHITPQFGTTLTLKAAIGNVDTKVEELNNRSYEVKTRTCLLATRDLGTVVPKEQDYVVIVNESTTWRVVKVQSDPSQATYLLNLTQVG